MTGRATAKASTERTPQVTPVRGTLGQRFRADLVGLASWLACHVPEAPLIRLAEVAGEIAYRVAPERAALARRNLARVCEWADANALGSSEARAAARDPRILERLVRLAFRHHARYYVEVARTPAMDERYVRERLLVETPELVDAVFGSERPAIFIGLHFGAIELPALVLSVHGRRDAVAPMETVGDPELQRWFVRTRGRVGIRIVGLREARRELVAALRRGSPVGLVADRDLTGGGIDTSFFGHSAPMPAGPALLADESGAAAFVVSVRRAGLGRYRGRLDPLPAPVEGNRRARVVGFLEAEARIFERIIADAPEQWWGCFFEIWPDVPAVPAVPAVEAA